MASLVVLHACGRPWLLASLLYALPGTSERCLLGTCTIGNYPETIDIEVYTSDTVEMQIFLIMWHQRFTCPVGLASLARACLALTIEHPMPHTGKLSLTSKPITVCVHTRYWLG